MSKITKIKNHIPAITKIANAILDALESVEEMDANSGINASVRKSGNKVVITVPISNVRENDLDFSFQKDNFTITVRDRSKSSNAD